MVNFPGALTVVLSVALQGGAYVALPPDDVEAEKASADYRLTVQLESVERMEASRTGGLDAGRATGRVVAVVRAPPRASVPVPGADGQIAFRVRTWPWSERDAEPPGPERLYAGPGAPLPRLEVWGSFRAREFVVSAFEVHESDEVETALDRIDRIEAVLIEAAADDLAPRLAQVTGLAFRAMDTDGSSGRLRADSPAPGGWLRAVELRLAGGAWLLHLSVGDPPCIRPADVTARHGSAARPLPVPPGRTLPAPWHLAYARPRGSLRFGFLMAQPHDYEGCLVEIDMTYEPQDGS